MKRLSPTLKEQIIEAWASGSFSENQLAERFDVSRAYVTHVVDGVPKRGVRRVTNSTLTLARELSSVMPKELSASFGRHFEDLTGGKAALLLTPGI
jgi:hypothetical protein